MRAVIQRVSAASVAVGGKIVGQTGPPRPTSGRVEAGTGLLVYLSVGKEDSDTDAEFMADKLAGLRIFADPEKSERFPGLSPGNSKGISQGGQGKMNLSIQDVKGDVLIVSNFTLHGDCRKGRRPGFDAACEPVLAQRLYDKTAQLLADKGLKVEKGVFGAYMQVESVNDGPVTFLLDSQHLF